MFKYSYLSKYEDTELFKKFLNVIDFEDDWVSYNS